VTSDDDKSENEMLAEMLLDNGTLFIGDADSGPFFEGETPSANSLRVYVNCNDLFAWACADAEELPLSEVPRLYRMWKADPEYGTSRWTCLRRNLAPQRPVEADWRKHGTWDAELDALPKP
jgi:hypothetical protein